MRKRFAVGTVTISVVLALLLSGCVGSRIVSTGADDAARAAANLIHRGADAGARGAAAVLLHTGVDDAAAFRSAANAAVDDAVQAPRWTKFKSQFAAKVAMTRESPLCEPAIDLVFAKDSEDVIDALYGLAGEADARGDGQELYNDTLDLIEIWENYDPAEPDKTYLTVSTALFQDFYCVD
ncbi:hypothetical protein E3O25_02610 [Cryobacterium sp. TMT1-3]|uniref:Lipoprotein n=1 Tax=Cryobacterium luteum TaxID=1424661 RepID=A0A1H8IJH3_9MICO|nr:MULTISPECIES: hypothetical protein [Cryobacterium]TFB95492.1 hypothetical protein E3O10_00100 [Cryobacterium luteum]TFC31358.1 hypothetical protein E3O25_02610 [Cryobacterium sp. TMT1-3]SEN68415.1 hypothetical protein SAMN05216281_111109 [Cryobacterium luteum]